MSVFSVNRGHRICSIIHDIMTEEKDYIMRMIAEFMRVISRALFLKETKQYYDAIAELDNLNRMISGFSLDQMKILGIEGFKYVYNLDKESDIEKIFCAAKILKEEGLILKEQGRTEDGSKSMELSLQLFEMIKDTKYKDNKEVLEEINNLK